VPLRRQLPGSFTAAICWLHYADNLPAPLCRQRNGSIWATINSHYAYYGIAGNFRALQRVHRAVERYWHKMLCSRSWAGRIPWAVFHEIKERLPLLRPRLHLSYRELQALAVL
jgi:hypothetical protein